MTVGSRVNARFEHIFLAFENYCVKVNAVRPVLYFRDSSFWQYKDYAGIRRGSLERRLQTTVGLRVMRTCCCCVLRCMRCVRNKLAISSDVGSYAVVGDYCDRK